MFFLWLAYTYIYIYIYIYCTNSKRLNQVSERVKYKGPINYNGR